MPFERGSFTFAMFDLNGELPDNLPALFKARKAGPLDSVSEEPQLGWVTGQHLLDTDIDENAMMGGCYYLTLRQAVRKMPTALLNAVCKREERAYMRANNLEYVSSKMKKQIKEEALEKHIQKMPPALSGIPMVLDPNEKLLYVGASSNTQIDLFLDTFFQTVKVEPIQLTPGLILDRKYQTTEVSFPELSFNGQKSSEPTIGRDFLTWL
ncbi:MAG: recombination-associated protein RdgC [Lentisphaeria bacterium]|nr:recombination-associated protein RdgC [Lentisphaeria bacterium]